MKYYGICVKDNVLKHVKYLRREWKNGGWKYYYDDPDNPTGIKETRAEKLAKTRQANAERARNKVYSDNARKAKEAEEAKKKAEKEAEEAKKKAGEEVAEKAETTAEDARSLAEEMAEERNERIADQRDDAYSKLQEKKKKAAIKRGQSVANNILLRRDYIK